jgi:hypothetical protein
MREIAAVFYNDDRGCGVLGLYGFFGGLAGVL